MERIRMGWKGIPWACILAMSLWGCTHETTQGTSDSDQLFKRAALMQSKGPEGSLTVLPLMLAGQPVDRVSEVVGVLLEQQGLKNIELGATPFISKGDTAMQLLGGALGEFVRHNPVPTEHALYAEYNGNREVGLIELRAIVVDKAGRIVWMDRQGAEDEAMKRLESKDPMALSVLLVERLCPALGLNEETAKAAKPGTMARRMEERSGLPSENERAPLPERQKLLKESKHKAILTVYPLRIGGTMHQASASELAAMINTAGLCKSQSSTKSLVLKASQADPNELKVLWDIAREFRTHVKQNPPETDYVLCADYVFNPEQWEQGYVHFVVCDRTGEWVIVDLQNSHQPDYQSVKPRSREDCSTLLVKRLKVYLEQEVTE